MKILFSIILSISSLLLFAQENDKVEILTKQGAKLKCKVLLMDKDKIQIERPDGRTAIASAETIESINGMSYEEFYKEKGKYLNGYDPSSYDEGYKASNGITYKVGDTIVLGRGSAANGDFRYLTMGGFGSTISYLAGEPIRTETYQIGSVYSGLGVVIKKIKKQTLKGIEKVYFVVGGGNITNYWLYIEDAIATCEVRECKQPTQNQPIQIINQSDKYDQLKKLKELLDAGIITQEEFDIEKKKLLDKD